jgi:hypothetical protein
MIIYLVKFIYLNSHQTLVTDENNLYKNELCHILPHMLLERKQRASHQLVQLLRHNGPNAQIMPRTMALTVEFEQLRNLQV